MAFFSLYSRRGYLVASALAFVLGPSLAFPSLFTETTGVATNQFMRWDSNGEVRSTIFRDPDGAAITVVGLNREGTLAIVNVEGGFARVMGAGPNGVDWSFEDVPVGLDLSELRHWEDIKELMPLDEVVGIEIAGASDNFFSFVGSLHLSNGVVVPVSWILVAPSARTRFFSGVSLDVMVAMTYPNMDQSRFPAKVVSGNGQIVWGTASVEGLYSRLWGSDWINRRPEHEEHFYAQLPRGANFVLADIDYDGSAFVGNVDYAWSDDDVRRRGFLIRKLPGNPGYGVPVWERLDLDADGPGGESYARVVSADHSTVGGSYHYSDGRSGPALWTEGQFHPLGVPTGYNGGVVQAVTGNGDIASGFVREAGSKRTRAFYWSAESGFQFLDKWLHDTFGFEAEPQLTTASISENGISIYGEGIDAADQPVGYLFRLPIADETDLTIARRFAQGAPVSWVSAVSSDGNFVAAHKTGFFGAEARILEVGAEGWREIEGFPRGVEVRKPDGSFASVASEILAISEGDRYLLAVSHELVGDKFIVRYDRLEHAVEPITLADESIDIGFASAIGANGEVLATASGLLEGSDWTSDWPILWRNSDDYEIIDPTNIVEASFAQDWLQIRCYLMAMTPDAAQAIGTLSVRFADKSEIASPVRWLEGEGLSLFGGVGGTAGSAEFDVRWLSDTGRWAGGSLDNHAYYWDFETGAGVLLPSLEGYSASEIKWISSDGALMLGTMYHQSERTQHAFAWTPSGGMRLAGAHLRDVHGIESGDYVILHLLMDSSENFYYGTARSRGVDHGFVVPVRPPYEAQGEGSLDLAVEAVSREAIFLRRPVPSTEVRERIRLQESRDGGLTWFDRTPDAVSDSNWFEGGGPWESVEMDMDAPDGGSRLFRMTLDPSP